MICLGGWASQSHLLLRLALHRHPQLSGCHPALLRLPRPRLCYSSRRHLRPARRPSRTRIRSQRARVDFSAAWPLLSLLTSCWYQNVRLICLHLDDFASFVALGVVKTFVTGQLSSLASSKQKFRCSMGLDYCQERQH